MGKLKKQSKCIKKVILNIDLLIKKKNFFFLVLELNNDKKEVYCKLGNIY